MSDKISLSLKKGVLENKRYTLKPIDCQIKLNQNESPLDLPLSFKQQVTERLMSKNWNIYPDFIPENIYQKIASHLKINRNQLLIGNGSNEMIFTLLCASNIEKTRVIIPTPTFTVYQLIASNLNAHIVPVMLQADYSFDTDQLLAQCRTPGSITIISSPNNPTGSFLPRAEIEKISEAAQGLVVIDEAYIHFGGQTCLDLIDQFENIVILRTFSKAFGLAGLRIGLMAAHEKLIEQLAKVKLPYNLDIFSLLTLDLLFDQVELINQNIEIILNEKKFVRMELEKLTQLQVFPSAANFFLIKADPQSGGSDFLFKQLVKENILVRDVSSYPMLENHLRISIGKHEENLALIRALKKILK